jgi:hypothetical protein
MQIEINTELSSLLFRCPSGLLSSSTKELYHEYRDAINIKLWADILADAYVSEAWNSFDTERYHRTRARAPK